jgi:hypothetical protein
VLSSFLDELAKIATFANAMAPPASAQSLGMSRLPGPSRVPNIDSSAAMEMNYNMHMPTVMADMQARAANQTVRPGASATPKTIPAPAAALPQSGIVPRRSTLLAPRPSMLGAPMSQRNVTTAITHLPTVRPAAAAGALGKLTKPLGGVLHAAHAV